MLGNFSALLKEFLLKSLITNRIYLKKNTFYIRLEVVYVQL